MRSRRLATHKLLCGVALCAMAVNAIAPVAAGAAQGGSNDGETKTPIKHVIVIIGENRTFDHLFATYQPVNQGETVWNLLSEGSSTPTAHRVRSIQPSPSLRRRIQ